MLILLLPAIKLREAKKDKYIMKIMKYPIQEFQLRSTKKSIRLPIEAPTQLVMDHAMGMSQEKCTQED